MSSRPPYPAPSLTTSSAADCRPRESPPASSPAVRASSSRRASGASASERLPRGPHREHDLLAGEDVALDGVAVTGEAARPVDTGVAGVRGGAAVDVDDADLALLALLVLLEQPDQRHRRGRAVVEVRQGQPLVGHVRVRLGSNRADSGDRGRYGGPDGEELRSHRHPPRLSVGGPGHDRERHGPHDSEPEHDRRGRYLLALNRGRGPTIDGCSIGSASRPSAATGGS